VDFLVQSRRDAELRKILDDAHLVVCDGTPLVWLSRLLRRALPERVAGSDLVPQLLTRATEQNWSVFFLGGQEQVLQMAMEKLQKQHPSLRIAGGYSPPFAPLDTMDHDGICARIRETKPDVLLVSFGCPKQEKWIARNYEAAGVPVCIGVGATIDFLAGSVKRAPLWMQVAGMEWIFRLAQEPRRLLKRYATDLVVFGIGAVKEILSNRQPVRA
jgi:exopolysaccharide biosynthesis WecB/TagA/CpsF family protein